MSTAVLNLINQLNPYEEEKVYDFLKKLIDERKGVENMSAKEVFYSIREDARKNGTMGMTLDEINDEIRMAREDRRKKKEGKFA